MEQSLICSRETSLWNMSHPTPEIKERQIPELLAPAGSREAFLAAVAAGADAVYLGGPRFGARHFAANFREDDISEAVRYAHLRGVKVYVTVNTLIQDSEIPDAVSYLLSLYRMGVDAVLIQDVGLLSLARKLIPGLPLHASTQCTISSREGALWARHAGCSRVVMARETPFSEIERLLGDPPSARPGIEIFVHGALCYSYSGQCLLSSVIGGRSGNRGMCAQPCRKSYCLVGGIPDEYGRPAGLKEIPCDGRYLLSTRDLCEYPALDRIIERGLDALKIEGRMRTPLYVRAVVGAYRKALDALKEGKSWHTPGDMETMALAFSRGFTRGYLFGEHGPSLMGRDQPGNRGLMLGTVVKSRGKSGGIHVRPLAVYIPSAGDGVLILDPAGGKPAGFALNRNAGLIGKDLILYGTPGAVLPGSRVYITKSMQLAAGQAEDSRGRSLSLKIPVRVKVRVVAGEPLKGWAWCDGRDGQVVSAECGTPFIPEKATAWPIGRDAIIRQVQKTGDTPFQVEEVEIDIQDDPFVPLSELNRLRRDLLSTLEDAWLRASLPESSEIQALESRLNTFFDQHNSLLSGRHESQKKEQDPALAVYCWTHDELVAACDAGCDVIYYEPNVTGWTGCMQDLIEGSRYCHERGILFIWKWPRVTGGHFIESALQHVHDLFMAGVSRIMVEELGMAEAVLILEPGMVILGGAGLNIYNAQAAQALHPPITGFTLSPELSSSQIATLVAILDTRVPGIRCEVYCQGNLEVMVSEDRLLEACAPGPGITKPIQFGIRDETGRIFPVYRDCCGRTHILNAIETTLIDRIPHLAEAGVSSLAIDARGRGGVYAREMTALYREGIRALSHRRKDTAVLISLKDRARQMARGGITRGHFVRGVAGFSEQWDE